MVLGKALESVAAETSRLLRRCAPIGLTVCDESPTINPQEGHIMRTKPGMLTIATAGLLGAQSGCGSATFTAPTRPGSYPFVFTFHANMMATLVVT